MIPADIFPGYIVTHIDQDLDKLFIHTASSTRTGNCPHCGIVSHSIHGHYRRHPKDLPWSNYSVQLELHVTRYKCKNSTCPRKTFSEAHQSLVSIHAQRTHRLQHIQTQVGLHLSANDSVQILKILHMGSSRDTVLRSLQQLKPPEHVTPRILGVDDWAICKGKRYGTILVDLEQHHVVDLLEGRDGSQLQTWLESHPGIEIIVRVALASTAEPLKRLRQLPYKWPTISTSLRTSVIRCRRGLSDAKPRYLKFWPRINNLKQFLHHLPSRFWQRGEQLESTRYKPVGVNANKQNAPKISTRDITRWLTMPREQLRPAQQELLVNLLHDSEEVKALYPLIQAFKKMIRQLCPENAAKLSQWVEEARVSEVEEFQRFARSLQRDFRAVSAGLTLSWSNAQKEGQVTKLKLIKRIRYGRCGFEFLRRCVLLA